MQKVYAINYRERDDFSHYKDSGVMLICEYKDRSRYMNQVMAMREILETRSDVAIKLELNEEQYDQLYNKVMTSNKGSYEEFQKFKDQCPEVVEVRQGGDFVHITGDYGHQDVYVSSHSFDTDIR